MTTRALLGIAASTLLVVTPAIFAHGGTYRGPGDTVPANPGGGGGKTPGPSGPTTPGPSGPTTPGPSGPTTPGPQGPVTGPTTGGGGGGPSRGPVTGPGMDIGDDLSKWQFWWEFNKDPFIKLKRAIFSTAITTGSDEFFVGKNKKSDAEDMLRPSQKEIATKVVPKLIQALETLNQRDITSSCLVALAKIGMEEDKILPLMKAKLPESDQEVSETAALAMGILASPKAVNDLIALLADGPAGRELCRRGNGVPFRTRSFAAYGLGLIAYANADIDLKEKIFDALKSIVEADRVSIRDLRIAAVNGMRLLRINPADGEKAEKLLNKTLDTLMAFYNAKKPNEEQSQAHVPVAIAKLLGKELDTKDVYKKRWVADLNEGKKSDWIRQSCALALGVMAKTDDEEYSKALQTYFSKGRDFQAKYFSLISLGLIGGEKNRTFLLQMVEDGKKLDKAWAALSLGVMNYHLREADKNAEIDTAAGALICKQLGENKNPEVLGGLAIALGLLKYSKGADDVLGVLRKNVKEDELAGYCCLALGLMEHRDAKAEIKTIVEESLRRPERLKQAAIGLGLLGDQNAAEVLIKFLRENTSLAAVSAVAGALGFIGYQRSLDPLTEMLFNKELTDIARAFAAVALGIVADKEEFPWNSKIAANLNYRANTETLTDKNSGTGILDIL
jgi:HEAT repeat protein